MDLPDFSKNQKFIALRKAMGIKPEDSVPATQGDWQEIKDIMDSPEYVEGTRILGLIKDSE
tara:strand:- start:2011 stop:2193 length:183 start_codon:yes stop_codon:yes gene_type:complete